MHNNLFIDRDLSWLAFNGRVLDEAAKPQVPLLERLKFLSIYSSNLDEFYRVRMPGLMAIDHISGQAQSTALLQNVNEVIALQLELFGKLLREQLIPGLGEQQVHFVYGTAIPSALSERCRIYFLEQAAAFTRPVSLSDSQHFFPENNTIYLAAAIPGAGAPLLIIAVPATECGRFFTITDECGQWVLLLDDIIRDNIRYIHPELRPEDCYSFKVTRDAAMDLADEFEGDLAEKIERQIGLRDSGLATRFLYDAAMPPALLQDLINAMQLAAANAVTGGRYHNLKDLAAFPVKQPALSYPAWPSVPYPLHTTDIYAALDQQDILLHVPYHSYTTLLHFFNRAAIDPYVTEIRITLYRIAGDSLIANALISAAQNGKDVMVFVELKARFDEANNIRWAKKMKAAGVKIIYSIPGLKVHAKIALVKRKLAERSSYYGIMATGNFNESTARFYTDHILLTANKSLLQELELLFLFLARRRMPVAGEPLHFRQLLVARFNLQEEFIKLIDQETRNAQQGLAAAITIKLNNLEEETMIRKLYEASQAGVQVKLLIRGICRIRPGVPGLSDNISVKRIVDRYLEHGRIFIFHNSGQPKVYLGSADWMNRNIYRRIEVCFPVIDPALQLQLQSMLQLQLTDTASAVLIDSEGKNQPIPADNSLPSQYALYQLIRNEEQ